MVSMAPEMSSGEQGVALLARRASWTREMLQVAIAERLPAPPLIRER
jgi:hypothetical protein